MRGLARIPSPATSCLTKRIQRSARPTRGHEPPRRLGRSVMIQTDLRPNRPDSAMLAAAVLGTDLYSFVQASFPTVSGGGRFLPNWHIEAIRRVRSLIADMRGLRRHVRLVPKRTHAQRQSYVGGACSGGRAC